MWLDRAMPSRRRVLQWLTFAALALTASGCNACSQFVPTQVPGAKLTAPGTAKAGDIITLDASGSQTRGASGFQDLLGCPKIIRFFADFRGAPASKKPITVIEDPELESGVVFCVVTEAKVRVKVPGAARAGTAPLDFTVNVESARRPREGGKFDPPLYSNLTVTTLVDTPAGQEGQPGGDPGPGTGEPANKPPVARFFPLYDPSVEGHAIDLDARESFDPDGTVTGYDWDFNGDGNIDLISNDPFATTTAGAPGTQRITLRVHDNQDATADAALDQLVVGTTGFTEGTFSSPTEVAVNTPFDVGANNNVGGADTLSLDTDNDGQFDDGLPSVTASPGAAQPQFSGMQYATGGYKRLAVLWHDNDAPNKETITTHLIKVTPFENPPAKRGAPALTAAKAGTRLSAKLTASGVRPVRVGKVSTARNGIAVKGLVIRGRLRGKVSARRSGQKVPSGIKVLTNATYSGSFNGMLPALAEGYGAPVGSGYLLARAVRDRKTMVCLQVKQRSAKSTSFKVLGATGKAKGLRASGKFPALLVDSGSRTAKLNVTVGKGSPKRLSKPCRALVKELGSSSASAARKLGAGAAIALLLAGVVMTPRWRRSMIRARLSESGSDQS